MHTLTQTLKLNVVVSGDTQTHTAQTLTASAATLGAQFSIAHAGQLSIDLIYTPAANTRNLSYYIEVSPDDLTVAEGSSNWFQLGQYTNSSGTWTKEAATYTLAGATLSTAYPNVPVEVPTAHQKARVRVLEDGVATFGTVKGWVNLAPFA